jgi:hypothetical protein
MMATRHVRSHFAGAAHAANFKKRRTKASLAAAIKFFIVESILGLSHLPCVRKVRRPVWQGSCQKPQGANSGTFYSAMDTIDFELGNDNASAVAVRLHVVQHGYLALVDFHVGSGLAALNDIGNLS